MHRPHDAVLIVWPGVKRCEITRELRTLWEARGVPEPFEFILRECAGSFERRRNPRRVADQGPRELVDHPVGLRLSRRIAGEDERNAFLGRDAQRVTLE